MNSFLEAARNDAPGEGSYQETVTFRNRLPLRYDFFFSSLSSSFSLRIVRSVVTVVVFEPASRNRSHDKLLRWCRFSVLLSHTRHQAPPGMDEEDGLLLKDEANGRKTDATRDVASVTSVDDDGDDRSRLAKNDDDSRERVTEQKVLIGSCVQSAFRCCDERVENAAAAAAVAGALDNFLTKMPIARPSYATNAVRLSDERFVINAHHIPLIGIVSAQLP